MNVRCSSLLCFFPCIGLLFWAWVSACASGQEVDEPPPVPRPLDIKVVPAMRLLAPAMVVQGNEIPDSRRENALRWIRGLIQRELHAIDQLCRLSSEQRQQLVNTAETQWKNRLATTIKGYIESHNPRQPFDFEMRVERLIGVWVGEHLNESQVSIWNAEIDSRNDMRKRLVIGLMVQDTERKLGLTAEQMELIDGALQERWKASWWSMYRTSTLPETKFSWISNILSDSQRTMGMDRGVTFSETYVQGGTIDLPSTSLKQRFEMSGVESDRSILLTGDQPSQELSNPPIEIRMRGEDAIDGPP